MRKTFEVTVGMYCNVQKWSWCSAGTYWVFLHCGQQSHSVWISPVWENVGIFSSCDITLCI